MPGITGIIGKAPMEDRKAALGQMVKCMQHEPFYNSGSLFVDKLECAAGWVSHAGSFSDCMPAWNEAHDICLVFWGEHFADASELQRLKAAGHQCTDSSAACLVHLYEEHGMKFFEMLNGTFHGLLIDLRENKLVLFNDRYGLGRIYYHEGPDGFYFSAEAKSLLKVLPQLRRLDLRSFGEFFSCGCALQHRTLFDGVSLLPPGSAWTFRPGQPHRKETYFQKEEWESLPQLPAEDYYQQLKETFTRILPRYFSGRQPVALSLTGGLDSRMIIAAAPRAPGALPCSTFGGMYRDSEDVTVGRQIARLCGQPYSVIKVDEGFFPQFVEAAKRCVYITDGAMDASAAVGMVVNRQVRQFAPVRMTGNYGSEILRGNVAFKPMSGDVSMFSEEFVPNVRAAPGTFASERRGNKVSFIAFKQVPWHHCCRFSEENSQLTIRSPYLDNELVRLAYQAPTGLLLQKQLALRYCSDLKPALQGAPTDRGTLDRPAIIPEKVYRLWKERRPKAEYYFDYGMPQWLAKVDRVLAPMHLERLFLGQQKYYHFRTWYRRELAGAVRNVLLDPVTLGRSYLNGRRVEQMVNAHTSGSGNYTLELHKLMTSELIERTLLRSL
jgi:asparagine synthase (glutamine-hydrolysing)